MDNRLEIVLAAKDVTGKAFANVKHEIGSLTKSVFSLNGAIVTMAGSFGAGIAFSKLSAESISAASALEEVSSKFAVVFEGQTEIANQWAKNLSDNFAMSTRESKKYLSSVQDLLVPMGLQSSAAANLSNEIVRLAADLGSFNDLSTSQVVENIQSALVGEYEVMKKYGVVINATRVQQEALNMGLAKTKEDLTAADKAQAAYKLIVESSTAAIGDMNRTADEYANTTKRLNSEWEDFTATLGQDFLPMVSSIKSGVAGMLDGLTKAMPRLRSAVTWGYTGKSGKAYWDDIDERKALEASGGVVTKKIGASTEGYSQYFQSVDNTDHLTEAQRIAAETSAKFWKASYESIYADFAAMNSSIAEGEALLTKLAKNEVQKRESAVIFSNEQIAEEFRKSHEKMYADIKRMSDLSSLKVYEYGKKAVKVGEETADAWTHAFDGWASGFSSTLNDMVWESEFSFNNIARSFGKMATQMMIQESIVSPFVSSFGPGISSFFKSFLPSADGNVFDTYGVREYAHGGAFTNSIVSKPTLFAHGGGFGIMGEAGEEAIIPLTRTSSGNLGVESVGASNNVEIIIQNAPPVKEQKKSRNSKGDRIEIIFENQMAAVAGGQNPFTNTIEKKYGLSPVLMGR